jgi:RimJ/RimL family protein N-acetyltransferase
MTEDRITSARVSLIPLTVPDAEEMAGVLSAGELYRFTGGRPPALDELRATYARQVIGHSPDGSEVWRNWIIRRGDDGAAVGYVQATIADGGTRAEIAWVVGLQWQGLGYATEAARALVALLDADGVAVIEAHVHPDHAASAAVARRAGLVPTERFDEGERLWRRARPSAAGSPGF